MSEINCNNLKLIFEEDKQIQISFKGSEDNIFEYNVDFSSKEAVVPEKFEIKFQIPLVELHNVWYPSSGYNHGLTTNYHGINSTISTFAPVVSLFSNSGKNALTLAYSDSINLVKIAGSVHEESCSWHGTITLFDGIFPKINEYHHIIRLDFSHITMCEAINNVVKWWESFPLLSPMETTHTSKLPMYSTWYSMHQNVFSNEMIEQCKIGSEIGLKSIIIDDGWQTEDASRGYAYCGDWEVCDSKIPSMKKLVEDLHEIDISVLLWYCVPLIGHKSKKWEELKTMVLKEHFYDLGCGILDPRYKDVREYIITTYENAVINWNLDGLKLDFIDCFKLFEESSKEIKDGMDFLNVSEATYELFKQMMSRLKAIKPDIMIEFRQAYIGPTMRAYGNIFRATDCPSDPFINRVRVLNLRLTSGNTVIHSDMIRWNDDDTDKSVAYHLWSTIFSVPQISVDLTNLSVSHKKVLANFLKFTGNNTENLIDTALELAHPETGFSLATAVKDNKTFVVSYTENMINAPQTKEFSLINAGHLENFVIDFSQNTNSYCYKTFDMYGEIIETGTVCSDKTLVKFATDIGSRIEFCLM